MTSLVRKYFRFNLRTLFVLMTVCALWLGYQSKRAHDQQVAVARVLELGGSVIYDYQYDAHGAYVADAEPPGWQWLRDLIGPHYFQDVVGIGLERSAVSNEDLALLSKLKRLRSLNLHWTGIADAGACHLGRMTQLRSLDLIETQITSAGLSHVARLKRLGFLNLGDAVGVDDNGLQHIGELTKLDTLLLGGTSLTSAGVSHLTNLRELRWLVLSNTAVDDAAIPHLVEIDNLRELWLEGTRISGPGLVDLRDRLPDCEVVGDIVDLQGLTISDAGNDDRRWQQLVARMRALNDEGLLKLINLSGSNVTDVHLASLYDLNNVEAIDLRSTKVTATGMEQLEQALPHCKCIR